LPRQKYPRLMKAEAITSLCEKGVDKDEGRWRLSFFHAGRVFRLTIDSNSQILGRARFDAPRRGLETK